MTIILPPGKWARCKWRFKRRRHKLWVKIRGSVDWKYAALQGGLMDPTVERKDIRRVKFTNPNTGKKSWIINYKVEIKLFHIDTTKPVSADDLLYLKINTIDGELDG